MSRGRELGSSDRDGIDVSPPLSGQDLAQVPDTEIRRRGDGPDRAPALPQPFNSLATLSATKRVEIVEQG